MNITLATFRMLGITPLNTFRNMATILGHGKNYKNQCFGNMELNANETDLITSRIMSQNNIKGLTEEVNNYIHSSQ